MTLTPVGDNIILELEQEKKEKTTASGIYVGKPVSEQSARKDIAVVKAVGEGRRLTNGTLIPPGVKANDKILYNKYAGTEIVLNENKYLIIKETDILAVIK